MSSSCQAQSKRVIRLSVIFNHYAIALIKLQINNRAQSVL